jgi:hypothetical protein
VSVRNVLDLDQLVASSASVRFQLALRAEQHLHLSRSLLLLRSPPPSCGRLHCYTISRRSNLGVCALLTKLQKLLLKLDFLVAPRLFVLCLLPKQFVQFGLSSQPLQI